MQYILENGKIFRRACTLEQDINFTRKTVRTRFGFDLVVEEPENEVEANDEDGIGRNDKSSTSK